MNFQLLSLLVFGVLLLLFFVWQRKRVGLQKILFPFLYFVIYRTKAGLALMDKLAGKCPSLIRMLSTAGVFAGFLGMIFVVVLLVDATIKLFTTGAQGIMLVLPVEVKGVFYVPIFYWIISIFVVAVVHEFSHGVVARLHGLKIKSSGLAFLCVLLPVIPAAFVEPDEKKLAKKKAGKQLGIFAAGPFSNIILAVLVYVLFSIVFSPAGVDAVSVNETGPAGIAGLRPGETIIALNNVPVLSSAKLSEELLKLRPGEVVGLKTTTRSYDVKLGTNPKNESLPYLGISSEQHIAVFGMSARTGSPSYSVMKWIAGLFYWIFVLSLGIGLFNLLPLGPIDGGRMFSVLAQKLFGKQKGFVVWKAVSIICLLLVVANLLAGFF